MPHPTYKHCLPQQSRQRMIMRCFIGKACIASTKWHDLGLIWSNSSEHEFKLRLHVLLGRLVQGPSRLFDNLSLVILVTNAHLWEELHTDVFFFNLLFLHQLADHLAPIMGGTSDDFSRIEGNQEMLKIGERQLRNKRKLARIKAKKRQKFSNIFYLQGTQVHTSLGSDKKEQLW